MTTYTRFDASESPCRSVFISIDGGVIAQFPEDALAIWVLGGLEYEGEPGTLGTWTTYPSDLNVGFWSVRDPANRHIAFVSNQALAEIIAEAMTNYPVEQPG